MAPSQRFRFEQYFGHLEEKGFTIRISPFFTTETFATLYQTGNLFPKIRASIQSYLRRLLLLFRLRPYNFIFLHREAMPIGPPVFEWFVANVFRKKIIYDFDDAIWLTDRRDESSFMRMLRSRSKVARICKWSYKVSCGNEYLADYARQYNRNVVVNPTTIDTASHVPRERTTSKTTVTIGWTGSHSTLKYLLPLASVFQQLEKRFDHVRFLVIADENPNLPLNNGEFRPWRKETEIEDLARIDIGVMPMPDDPWTRGKCGFKALQYMAMEIPAVVSPVGINKEIITPKVDGYWCTTNEEWLERLSDLIRDEQKRREMGKRGREKVINHYSVTSNTSNFLSLFQ